MNPENPDTARWFTVEVLPHEAHLRAWLRGRFPSITDLDDLIQDAYARLLRAYETGPIACPRAFAFVTARNLALNRLRQNRWERNADAAELDALAMLDESVGPADAMAHAEEFQFLLRAIDALPAKCRQVITLRKIYGLSQKEVANRLEVSERTVETQAEIGLRKCSEYFRRHGYLKGRP